MRRIKYYLVIEEGWTDLLVLVERFWYTQHYWTAYRFVFELLRHKKWTLAS